MGLPAVVITAIKWTAESLLICCFNSQKVIFASVRYQLQKEEWTISPPSFQPVEKPPKSPLHALASIGVNFKKLTGRLFDQPSLIFKN